MELKKNNRTRRNKTAYTVELKVKQSEITLLKVDKFGETRSSMTKRKSK